ncbi:maleylpyruvate isomerase N-terminal domain-containing protein [Jatrophihabitans sp.]|uniref:maleylpyruvate isomerase N-terminal domain-containing protein n=1 Tax=Jatrophihabitans sp. TaxID=1932789 RepID=UPI002C436AF9|nr:maleylpyruvate isomerase N-terminal domain-containing protein [Jatrophihabitans sp.]
MSGLTIDPATAGAAFAEQVTAFLAAVEPLDDRQLLAASRCHGWAVLDVVVHVRGGLEEMLRGCTAPTADPPTADAASYWTAAADPVDPVDGILWTRRTASAYSRPRRAVRHLRDAADAVLVATRQWADAEHLAGSRVRFQGHVLTAADFLATWAVELAVHQLDLGRDLDVPAPPAAALRLARATVEALLERTLPGALGDLEVLLLGAGRRAVPPELTGLIRPVLG